MHVCHLTSAHRRNDVRIFVKECSSLVAHGYRLTMVVADGAGSVASTNVAVVDVGQSSSRIGRMISGTRRIKRAALNVDADVYHFHDPELIPVGLALKDFGKRVIFDAHEDLAKQLLSKPYLNEPLLRIISWFYERYEKERVHRFDAIVTATPSIRNKFTRMHAHVVDINNYPHLNELSSPDGWGDRDPAICYVGGMCRIRGTIELVKALPLTKAPTLLHAAGEISDSEAEIRLLPGWSRVKNWGHVGRMQVRAIMAKAMAGVVTFHPVPNHIDAQPNKMFEYMSAGIPVIASHFPLWREIVEGNKCGLCVDPMDPQAIANAIDTLVGDPTMAQEMGANGRRAVVERYNWAIEERKLFALYDELAHDVFGSKR